jgi:signal transduction histidine kinase
MNAMCSRLSLLPKTLEIQRVETDLNDLVQSMLMELHDSLQARLHCDLQPLPKLTVDPEQIQKVLLNLLLNANEALTTGGHIWVTTAQRSGWAVLSVRDNGCGMSPTFIEQSLFHPFRTTKSQGLGIGLFHCRTIVDVHKGRVEVESVEGQGSTFRVLLPLTDMAVP